MPDETFSTLIPQHGDTPEILRLKLGVAASRLVAALPSSVSVDVAATRSVAENLLVLVQQLVPLPVSVRCLENYCYGAYWQQVTYSPTYFRRANVWGATLAGVANQAPMRLRHGTNDNRILNPGQMLTIEAPPGQQLNLQAFQFYGGYYYYGDSLAWELY